MDDDDLESLIGVVLDDDNIQLLPGPAGKRRKCTQ